MILTPRKTSYEIENGIIELYNLANEKLYQGKPISSFNVKTSEEVGQMKEIQLAIRGTWIALIAVSAQVILQLIDWYLQYFKNPTN
ncbi:MAG: hypothetical protein GWN00_26215 [Aliifodinibius sp.]|nr:hypothetical protein [Fodinibius sp.]NIY28169.1 hypothetical protein [Fodinibius sp.]